MLSWIVSSPSYLIALFSLAVPIVIHLFSKSKGKPIAVGTMKFFQQLKPVKMTHVKLVDRLLLLLRLLMLIWSVLLIAQLWWLENENSKNSEFYLITTNWLNFSSIEEKRELADKLNEDNAYILEPTLIPLSKEQILMWGKTAFSYRKPLWSALNSAHYQLPKYAKFHIYTDTYAINFIGEPLKISQSIQWHIITRTIDSSKTTPLKITVVADADRTHSVLRIKQALTLIKSAIIPELSFDIIESQQTANKDNLMNESISKIITNTDWLFYLSSEDNSLLLQSALNQSVTIFMDTKVLEKKLNKTILVSAENELLLEDALFYKQGVSHSINALLGLAESRNEHQSTVLWHSTTGFQVLTKHEIYTADKPQVIYQLNSRLEPDWSSLAEQPQFVRVLLSLIQNQKSDTYPFLNSDSQLSVEQIQAFDTTDNAQNEPEPNKTLKLLNYSKQGLTQWLMILLIIFWCLDRLLSERLLVQNEVIKKRRKAKNSPDKSESV